MTQGSRADGMLWSFSRSNVVCSVVLRVSTIGLSPVTVIVSCTSVIASCALIWAVNPISTRTPSRTSDLKPGMSNFTV